VFLGIIASILGLTALGLSIIPFKHRWNSRRKFAHLVKKPSSRALITLILISTTLLGIVAIYITHILERDIAGPQGAVIGAAALAAVGWIYTSHQSRRLSIISHTQDLIGQHRTSTIYEEHRRNIMRRFPVGLHVDDAAIEDILAQQKSREQHWAEKPPLYYSIQQTLNFHEYIASGIRFDQLDEAIIEKYQKAILVGAVIKFYPFIQHFRKDNAKNYSHIQWIISYWYNVDIDEQNGRTTLINARKAEA